MVCSQINTGTARQGFLTNIFHFCFQSNQCIRKLWLFQHGKWAKALSDCQLFPLGAGNLYAMASLFLFFVYKSLVYLHTCMFNASLHFFHLGALLKICRSGQLLGVYARDVSFSLNHGSVHVTKACSYVGETGQTNFWRLPSNGALPVSTMLKHVRFCNH